MFQLSVKSFSVCLIAMVIAACSSSSTKDESAAAASKQSESKSPSKSESKAPSKKGVAQEEVAEAAVPVEPVGPPPIPPEAAQRFDNAVTLLSAGDLSRAEPELKALAESYPEYSGALANLGILYLKSGKLSDAEKALLAATQRSPQNAMAFNQLGIVYRKMGRFKDADAAYGKAIAADPNYALAHLNLGVLCDLYLQQPARALASFERYSALAQKPDTRVATWMKELQGRVKSERPPTSAAE